MKKLLKYEKYIEFADGKKFRIGHYTDNLAYGEPSKKEWYYATSLLFLYIIILKRPQKSREK